MKLVQRKGNRASSVAAALLLFAATCLAASAQDSVPIAEEGADRGTERWRAGDREGAVAAWAAELEGAEDIPALERARLAYNLGVAEFEREEPLRAAAWFEAALRAAPRFGDARANLEIARAEAGLEPRSGDGLTATLGQLASSVTRPESEWLALFGAALVAAAGIGEALRGGAAWRRAILLALLVQPVLFAPLVRHLLDEDARPYMVIDSNGAKLRSAPSTGSETVGSLRAGEVVEFVDELPGWTKVATGDDERWVPADTLFALRL